MSDVATTDRYDVEALRLERLARLQAAMHAHDVEVCLLFNEPNIRYATGASAMPVYAMSTFVRCALVPAEGTPILFEHGNSMHRSALRAPDVRRMHAWEFFDDPETEADAWADQLLPAVREVGAEGATIAVDRLGTPAFLALARRGIGVGDSAPVTQDARRVKTPQELRLLDVNAALVMEMLTAFDQAIAPDVSERDLLAVLAGVMIRGGGEYLATNTVCSGPNTNPWRAEVTDRRLESGDLVYVDTDTVGIEGMFFCVSRTFLAGDAPPSTAQRDAYRASHEWLREMEALIRGRVVRGARDARPTGPRALPCPALRVHGSRYRSRGGEPERVPRPVFLALAAHDGRADRRRRPHGARARARHRGPARTRARSAGRCRPDAGAVPLLSIAIRMSSRAASASAWRSHGR